MKSRLFAVAASLLVAGTAVAQTVSFDVEQLECLPEEANQMVAATVKNLAGGDTVRAYFRRVNPEGAFYYVEMAATAKDRYWAVLPKPEDREQQEITDEWWEESLSTRDWLEGRERDDAEALFEGFENEAAEYYVAVYDAAGALRKRSDVQLVEVRERDDCEVSLAPVEEGFARNLTVGETTDLQRGKTVFHWLCDGIVTRQSSQGILRPDEFCRACVVAWLPAAVAGAAIGVVTAVELTESDPVSRITPVP